MNEDSEAAAWAARLDARPGEALPELEAWLAADPRHSGALLRAQAILSLLGGDTARAPAEPERVQLRVRRAGWPLALGGALTALAAAVALVLLVPGSVETYQTTSGETKQVALADGSALAIDARTRLQVDFDRGSRLIRLENGRAIFRAAKDDRPFKVLVGKIAIIDIGTEFKVFDDPATGQVEVLVTEGKVRVESPSDRKILVAGQRVRLGRNGRFPATLEAEQLSTRDILRTTAWREGRLELDGETLAEAVAQLNRANALQIAIADPALGAKELYGSFQIDDPRGFAQAVAVSLDTTVSERSGTSIIGF